MSLANQLNITSLKASEQNRALRWFDSWIYGDEWYFTVVEIPCAFRNMSPWDLLATKSVKTSIKKIFIFGKYCKSFNLFYVQAYERDQKITGISSFFVYVCIGTPLMTQRNSSFLQKSYGIVNENTNQYRTNEQLENVSGLFNIC